MHSPVTSSLQQQQRDQETKAAVAEVEARAVHVNLMNLVSLHSVDGSQLATQKGTFMQTLEQEAESALMGVRGQVLQQRTCDLVLLLNIMHAVGCAAAEG